MPDFKDEFLDVINDDGNPDRLLLLHISNSVDQVIRTTSDETYLRIADKSKVILGEDLIHLEYAKNTRHFEDECCIDAEIDDLDNELINQYKTKINANDIDTIQLLKARGFIKKQNNEEYLTNACILLFAKNPMQF